MNRAVAAGALFVILLGVYFASGINVDLIQPGHVGIRVSLYGTAKGVVPEVIGTGRVIYNDWVTEIHEFPTFTQNMTWAKEGTASGADESLTFNSSEGAIINADVGLSFTCDSDKVPVLYQRLRRDIEGISHDYMRSRARDEFSRHASTLKVIDIIGPKKQELLKLVQEDLNNRLKEFGIVVDMITFVGGLRVDANVEKSINATITASQKAIEAQNKIVQSKAEADQKIENARGEAESIKLRALAESESITLKATANANANKLLAASVSQQLVFYQAIQKWDGKVPVFLGGENITPFMQIKPEVDTFTAEK